jgi:hypothetical protein
VNKVFWNLIIELLQPSNHLRNCFRLHFAASWAHPGFSELQATSHTTPANSQGVTLGDVVPAVCCSSCVVCLG